MKLSVLKEIEIAVSKATHEMVPIENLLPPNTDIRLARNENIHSKEVIESCNRLNLLNISELLVMKEPGVMRRHIDGMTRSGAFSKTGTRVFPCMVLPHLSLDAQIILNVLRNSKRANLSDIERMNACKALKNNYTLQQIAGFLGVSIKDVNRHITLSTYQEEILNKVEKGEIKQQTVEVSIEDLHLSEKVPTHKKEEIERAMISLITKKNLGRDVMRDDLKVGRTLKTHAELMYKDYTPEQITRSAILKYSSTDLHEFDMIAEHPRKFRAFEEVVKSLKPKFCLILCADGPYLYDKETRERVESESLIITKYLPKEKIKLVGLFEGVKIDDVKKLEIPHYQGDMFDYLSTLEEVNTERGLIYINSNGTPVFYAEYLLEVLIERFPNATICFLVQDQFHNRRNDVVSLKRGMITFWGIRVLPKALKKFKNIAEEKLGIKIDVPWEEEDKRGQPMAMFMLRR